MPLGRRQHDHPKPDEGTERHAQEAREQRTVKWRARYEAALLAEAEANAKYRETAGRVRAQWADKDKPPPQDIRNGVVDSNPDVAAAYREWGRAKAELTALEPRYTLP